MAAFLALGIGGKARVGPSTSIYVHLSAIWRRRLVFCTHVAHEAIW
jgi:hypothetical protein